jgi:hypothetical protein
MGLLSSLLGNASEIDISKVQQELAPVLVPAEVIGRVLSSSATYSSSPTTC